MPTITLRIDDETKAELDAVARGRGVSLSDLMRSAIDAVLLREEDATVSVAPRSLTVVERQQLSLLHRILARVIGDDNDVDGDKSYQLERASVLEGGFVMEYMTEFSGIEPELSATDSRFVVDVLDMFRTITFSVDKLVQDGVVLSDNLAWRLRFSGFDLRDAREGRLLAYARYLISEDRWSELQYAFSDDNDRGNSHMRVAEVYERMLTAHAKVKAAKGQSRVRLDSYLLTLDELQRLADAQDRRDQDAR